MMTRGDKFSVKASLDVEILGFYPKGETKDGKAKYVCSVNGYKMTVEADFLEMLKESNIVEEKQETIVEEKQEEKATEKKTKKGGTKNGRRK